MNAISPNDTTSTNKQIFVISSTNKQIFVISPNILLNTQHYNVAFHVNLPNLERTIGIEPT